ncbi:MULTISPECIES: hypothetical protein [unclassified Pseudomonas]|uniref:hypothetical protein n=1 Tax=unclassified Pseudomonas TaxID=196821 RepID=UPI0028930DF6|nr:MULTISPECIES: hypothetical protein [unclassified Pseudomonas]
MAWNFLLLDATSQISETGFRKHQSTCLRQGPFDLAMGNGPLETDERYLYLSDLTVGKCRIWALNSPISKTNLASNLSDLASTL